MNDDARETRFEVSAERRRVGRILRIGIDDKRVGADKRDDAVGVLQPALFVSVDKGDVPYARRAAKRLTRRRFTARPLSARNLRLTTARPS